MTEFNRDGIVYTSYMTDRQLKQKIANIKVLALDCDGVMTPAFIETGIIMSLKESNQYKDRTYSSVFESAKFSHRDGQGIERIQQKDIGIKVVVITGQRSGYIHARCDKMNVPCIQTQDKEVGLKKWLSKNSPRASLDEVCFMGDDIGDIKAMQIVGLPVTVADGDLACKKIAHYITRRKGGDHAVREICDLIIQSKKLTHGKK